MDCFLGGKASKPPRFRFAEGLWVDDSSAKRNSAFRFFFWKKKNITRFVDSQSLHDRVFVGKPLWFRLAEGLLHKVWGQPCICNGSGEEALEIGGIVRAFT
jgi:hypothetical protein